VNPTRSRPSTIAAITIAAAWVAWVAAGCGGDDPANGSAGGSGSTATDAATADGFTTFVERASAAGIDFRHTDGSSGNYYIVETLASGVGLFDFDQDGDLDIYLLSGRALPPTPAGNADPRAQNELWENLGGGHFRDVTDAKRVPGVGFSIGCCAGDYDGDGDLDLYVTGFGSNVLYRNDRVEAGSAGARSAYAFTDVTQEAGVDDPRFSAGCAFVDHDRDGDLDLYVANYCEVDFATSQPCRNNGVPGYCAPGQYKPVHDAFFRNDGAGKFTEVGREVGVVTDAPAGPGPKWGMGVTVFDWNDDGWPDIYVANDVSDNFLLENQQNGKFRHVALEHGVAVSTDGTEQGSMGVASGDFDRDGRSDVLVTNYHKQLNALYRHEGAFGFSDQALGKGLGESTLPMVSWGTAFFDADHDGWLDIFIANGHLEDQIHLYDDSSEYRQQNQIFRNRGGSFVEVTERAGPGLAEKLSSRGAAFGDIDGDGDVDIVVNNSRERPSLLINECTQRRSWVRLELRGRRNRFAIGARVRVTANGVTWIADVQSGGSYCSQNDLGLHFGLGDAARVERVEVRWPEGGVSMFADLEVGRTHVLEE